MKSYRSFSDTPNDNYTMSVYQILDRRRLNQPLSVFLYGKHENFKDISDIYVENADYVKISNVTIGYNF
jgi:hypothetical protein